MEDPIKKKIQELCPDVMELKFGCEILLSDGVRVPITSDSDIVKVVRRGGINKQEGRKWWMENGYDYSEGFFEILGSPITLAVVLRAIGTSKNVYAHSSGVLINFDSNEVFNGKTPGMEWDFLNDNYDAQTKETQLFIGSLLGV